MEFSIEQQIIDLIKKSSKILIFLPSILNADSLASGLALKQFLTKMQKEAEVVTVASVPENLKFLPGADGVKNSLASQKSLVIHVDTKVKKLEEISYQTELGRASIYLKSQTHDFTPEDLSFSLAKSPVDLVVILSAKSLEDLGGVYEQQADLFFETPKVNIDNQADNEYFGAVNMVDVTATSVAEILVQVFEKYEEQLIDENIATCLLAGIIDKTSSFQHVKTTPNSFLKASQLVALGARQQEIIKHIYKTKSLSLLKLWGRALARMKLDEESQSVVSTLSLTDFEKSEATEDYLLPTLKEFLDNVSGYKVLALVSEPVKEKRLVLAAVHEQVGVEKFLKAFPGQSKVLEIAFGNHKVVEIVSTELTLESLEQQLTAILKI